MKGPMDYFRALSAIPRVSGNEAQAADFVARIAQEHGCAVQRDAMHNLIVTKPASPGFEAADTLLLQGHLDMVGEAAPGVEHDFAADPITLVVEGDILRAAGTTLGADDGVAVAYLLAILSDDTLIHPPLECVFTAQEETGLHGAMALDKSGLQAKAMVNLDAGPEGVFIATCAGGGHAALTCPLSAEPAEGSLWEIRIAGLRGGHSGSCIQLERGNALVLAGLAADELRRSGGRLVSLHGGDKDNVIPSEAVLCAAFAGDPSGLLTALSDTIKACWRESDPGLTLTWTPCPGDTMLDQASSDRTIDLLLTLPHGVVSRNAAMPELVETSSNLAVLRADGDGLEIHLALRSSSDFKKSSLLRRITRLAELFGLTCSTSGFYPGWSYDPESGLREDAVSVYRDLYGNDPVVEGIHAGLECGVFKGAMPWLDIIALGPTYRDMHTPAEWMDLPSFSRTYTFLTALLERRARRGM